MVARSFVEFGFPILLGLAIIIVGYRSRKPRRDLALLVIPAVVWTGAHLILGTPPTKSPLVNTFLLFAPLVGVFFLLAKNWPASGPAE